MMLVWRPILLHCATRVRVQNRSNRHKLEYRRLPQSIRKYFFFFTVSTVTGSPGRFWYLPHRSYSKGVWAWPCIYLALLEHGGCTETASRCPFQSQTWFSETIKTHDLLINKTHQGSLTPLEQYKIVALWSNAKGLRDRYSCCTSPPLNFLCLPGSWQLRESDWHLLAVSI